MKNINISSIVSTNINISWMDNYTKLLIKNIENELFYYIYGCVEKRKAKNKNLIYFVVQSIYIQPEYRGKKISYLLFYNLCTQLSIKFGWSVALVLDDCSGLDYQNNLYSKLNFLVLNANKRWVRPKNFIKSYTIINEYRDGCNYPSEKRYARLLSVYKSSLKKLKY
jgi:hypothetical protein